MMFFSSPLFSYFLKIKCCCLFLLCILIYYIIIYLLIYLFISFIYYIYLFIFLFIYYINYIIKKQNTQKKYKTKTTKKFSCCFSFDFVFICAYLYHVHISWFLVIFVMFMAWEKVSIVFLPYL